MGHGQCGQSGVQTLFWLAQLVFCTVFLAVELPVIAPIPKGQFLQDHQQNPSFHQAISLVDETLHTYFIFTPFINGYC